jgi:hypothetical protein
VAVSDLCLKSYADFPRSAKRWKRIPPFLEARGGEAIGLEVDVTDSAAVNR